MLVDFLGMGIVDIDCLLLGVIGKCLVVVFLLYYGYYDIYYVMVNVVFYWFKF